MSSCAIRYYSLLLAILIYACFSSPTPNTPGIAELIIAILLTIACLQGAINAIQRLTSGTSTRLDLCAGVALAIAGCAPILTGVLNNNPIHSVSRDTVSYLFLLIPFLTYDIFNTKKQIHKLWIATICIVALLLAIRSLEKPLDLALSILSQQTHELTYFANSPLILFAAGLCYLTILNKQQNHAAIIKIIALTILTLCTISIAITLQRASLAALAIIAITAHLAFIKRSPFLGICAAIAVASLTILTTAHYELPFTILSDLAEKTQIHGLNKRAEEWRSVFDILTSSWQSTLFGNGWGAGFYSPAADGEYVYFTHSLISSMLLKTGIMGLCATIPYLLLFYKSLYNIATKRLTLALCLAFPITIDIALYGAYKSLDFGLILLTTLIIEKAYFSGEKAR